MSASRLVATELFDEATEQSLLGALLITPEMYYKIGTVVDAADYWFVRHQYIYSAISHLIDTSQNVDTVTVAQRLSANHQLDDCGGISYLTQLIADTPNSVYAEVYAGIVRRLSDRRKGCQLADDIKLAFMDSERSYPDVVKDVSTKTFQFLSGNGAHEPSWYEAVSQFNADMLEVWEHPGKTLGIPTGMKEFDEYTLGLQKQNLIYVAARPRVGKSVLLGQWALHAARQGYHVGYWTGEMSKQQLIERAICHISGFRNDIFRRGHIPREQQRQITDALVIISELPMTVWDKAAISPGELHLKVLEQQAHRGLDILFIDYVGLMRSGERTASQVHEVTAISKGLMIIKNDCKIPVVAAVQLNREVEKRQDKHPQLYDLRDSGSLEQDADIVLGLYRDDLYTDASQFPGTIEVQMIKNRHGDMKTFYGQFNGPTSTITPAVKRQARLA